MNAQALSDLKQELANCATLIVVSKHHIKEEIEEVASYGPVIFGESKVQELKQKYDPAYTWHMIGHLQRNKVKDVVPLVDMIQSVDRLSLVEEIEKQCAKIDKRMPVLVEVNISKEPEKSGIALEDTLDFVNACKAYPHLDVQGLMCVGPKGQDERNIRACFEKMHQMFQVLQAKYGDEQIRYLSMGMSNDYRIALNCGSNMVRIGSMIMGERDYSKKI